MISNYYNDKQLKKWIVSFANIFAGMTVKTGKDGCGNISEVDVPITYASKDRVVALLGTTQNKQHTIPMMSCYMTNLELAADRRHGINMVDRRTFMKQGGVFPDDVKVVRRVMPIPYDAMFDLHIYASNTDQLFQILEPIFILFDPIVQIQKSDAPFDWTKITSVELVSISNEEVMPMGESRRIINWNLSFKMPIWLSPPMELKDDIVTKIKLRMGDIKSFHFNELDEEGNLAPFAEEDLFADTTIDGVALYAPVDRVDPGQRDEELGGQSIVDYHGYNDPTSDNKAGIYPANLQALRDYWNA